MKTLWESFFWLTQKRVSKRQGKETCVRRDCEDWICEWTYSIWNKVRAILLLSAAILAAVDLVRSALSKRTSRIESYTVRTYSTQAEGPTRPQTWQKIPQITRSKQLAINQSSVALSTLNQQEVQPTHSKVSQARTSHSRLSLNVNNLAPRWERPFWSIFSAPFSVYFCVVTISLLHTVSCPFWCTNVCTHSRVRII